MTQRLHPGFGDALGGTAKTPRKDPFGSPAAGTSSSHGPAGRSWETVTPRGADRSRIGNLGG